MPENKLSRKPISVRLELPIPDKISCLIQVTRIGSRTVDAQLFKNVMSNWATGIAIVTTVDNGVRLGFTVNSFASVSIAPLLISMSVAKSLYAGEVILKSGFFAINLLRSEQVEWAKLFAGFIPEVVDRFEGIEATAANNGCPILPDTLAWMSCRVYKDIDVGASTLILGEVQDAQVNNGEPLLYMRREWGRFSIL